MAPGSGSFRASVPEETTSASAPSPSPPGQLPANYLQLILSDLIHTAPAAAQQIVSLLPRPTIQALAATCKAARELTKHVCTHLTFFPVISQLPDREIAAEYPHVTALYLSEEGLATGEELQSGLEHLCSTCPLLLAKIRNLEVGSRYFEDGSDAIVHGTRYEPCLGYEAWEMTPSLTRLLRCCTSLQVLQMWTHHCAVLTVELPDVSPSQKQLILRQLIPFPEGSSNECRILTHPGLQPYITHLAIAVDHFPDASTAHSIIAGASRLESLQLTYESDDGEQLSGLMECLRRHPPTELTSLEVDCTEAASSGQNPVPFIMQLRQLQSMDVASLCCFPASLQLMHLTYLRLHFSQHSPYSSYDGICNLVSLQHLVMRDDTTAFCALQVLLGLHNLQHLTQLDLCRVDAGELSRMLGQRQIHLPALEVLHSRNDLGGSQVSQLLKHLVIPRLKSIVDRLSVAGGILARPGFPADDAFLPASVIQKSTNAISVRLGDADDLVAVAKTRPDILRYPRLSIDSGVDCNGIMHLVEELGIQLQHLDLSEVCTTGVGDATLAVLAWGCSSLRTLGLRAASNRRFTNVGLAEVSGRMLHLQRLELRGCVDLDDQCFTALVRGCPELQHIEMDGLEGVSEQGLMSLAQHNDVGVGKKLVIRCKRGLTANEIMCLHQAGWEVDVVSANY